MNGFRIDVVVHCNCVEGEHVGVAFRTPTSGLVVAQWIHKNARGDRWTILHLATGLAMPSDFGDPESAMACAHALGGDVDWTTVDPAFDKAATRSTLAAFGGEGWGAAESGPREQRNEVPA